MIKLEKFDKSAYGALLSWVDSEESLMQFAGSHLSYPLTSEQLDRSEKDPNRYSFSVIEVATGEHIGHCEAYLQDKSVKLGRVIIGPVSKRGKGFGRQVIVALVDFGFKELGRSTIELNVFDWNAAAIRCYEKVGFRINPGVTFERKVKDQTWTALNMVLEREEK